MPRISHPEKHPLIEAGKIAVVPGVFDVLSAKLAEQAGFVAAVLTGYGVSAVRLGEPDFGLLTQTEVLDSARRVCGATSLRLIVDGDTGYGGPLNVQRMVRELLQMGAFGLILEDQEWPKRCGHMRNKSVIDAAEHAEKIRAAVDQRGSSHLTITGRTDALATHGLEEALRRARLYKDSGADVLFVEGPRTIDELRVIGKELPQPLAVNLIEGGQTPVCTVEELRDMGYFSVGFVLTGLYAAAHSLAQTYSHLIRAAESESIAADRMNFDQFGGVVGLDRRYDDDERYRVT